MDTLSIIWTILLTIVIAHLVKKYLKWKQWTNRVDLIPGPSALPILGNALQIANKREEFAYDIGRKFKTYGSVFRLWYGLNASISVYKAEHMELVMSGSKHMEKSFIYDFFISWLGDGLLMSRGAKWHSRRKLITPAFHFKILEVFHHVFTAKSDILVKRLEKYCELGEAFDIYSFISHATLDVICEAAMGTNVNAQGEKQSDYIKATYAIAESLMYRARRIWLYAPIIYDNTEHGKAYKKLLNTLHSFTLKVIKERRAHRKNQIETGELKVAEDAFGSKKRFAFLDLLLDMTENGSALDEASLREEVDTFMFEGHDTTASGISWTLFLLGNYPQYQDLVAQELNEIFQGEDRPITMDDISEMKYLDRVIKESMRLCPPVPYIARQADADIEFDGFIAPAGTNIDLFIFHLHRDTRFFPDPERFDPDRFLPENCKGRHPYAYLPFSAGPRNCIGQKFAILEEKVVLASILRKYKITSMDKLEDIHMVIEMILRPANGFHVKLEPRSK